MLCCENVPHNTVFLIIFLRLFSKAPKSPQNLTTENFQDKNVTVRWSSSRGAEMYKVFVTATKPEAHVTKLYATKGKHEGH